MAQTTIKTILMKTKHKPCKGIYKEDTDKLEDPCLKCKRQDDNVNLLVKHLATYPNSDKKYCNHRIV